MKQEQRWIRHDNSGDLINSLEHCLHSLDLTKEDPRNWKWVIIASYAAAQVAMVMALESELKHLKPGSRKALLEYLEKLGTESEVPYPFEVELNSFDYLLKNAWPKVEDHDPSHERFRALLRLKALRDDFSHFGHYGSSVEVSLARIAASSGIWLARHLPVPFDEAEARQYESVMEMLEKRLSEEPTAGPGGADS